LRESSNVKFEFSSLGELSEASSDGQEVFLCDRCCGAHERLPDVVHPVLLQPEAVRVLAALQKQLDVATDAAGLVTSHNNTHTDTRQHRNTQTHKHTSTLLISVNMLAIDHI